MFGFRKKAIKLKVQASVCDLCMSQCGVFLPSLSENTDQESFVLLGNQLRGITRNFCLNFLFENLRQKI